VLEAGGADTAEYTVTLTAISPQAKRVASVNFPVTVEKGGEVVRILRSQALDVEIDEFGTWRLVVEHNRRQLPSIGLVFKRMGEAD